MACIGCWLDGFGHAVEFVNRLDGVNRIDDLAKAGVAADTDVTGHLRDCGVVFCGCDIVNGIGNAGLGVKLCVISAACCDCRLCIKSLIRESAAKTNRIRYQQLLGGPMALRRGDRGGQ